MKYLVHRCSISRESTCHHPSSWVESQSTIIRRHCSSINKRLLLEMSLRNSHCLVQGCWHWWRCICSTKLLLSCFRELRNYDTFILALLILILPSPSTQFPSTMKISSLVRLLRTQRIKPFLWCNETIFFVSKKSFHPCTDSVCIPSILSTSLHTKMGSRFIQSSL